MQTQANTQAEIIAKCGLYCNNCKSFKSGKCLGCEANTKAGWCKIRTCCIENNYANCSECKETNPRECKKFNNFVSTFFSLIFRSDRPASVEYIKQHGREAYIRLLNEHHWMVIKK